MCQGKEQTIAQTSIEISPNRTMIKQFSIQDATFCTMRLLNLFLILLIHSSSTLQNHGAFGFTITANVITRIHTSPSIVGTTLRSSHYQSTTFLRKSTTATRRNIIIICRKQQSRQTSLRMIFGGGTGGSTTTKVPTLPRDVKEAVTKCREATQRALQDRVSRMDIDFPVGTKFGVEKIKKKQSKLTNGDDKNNIPTKDDFDTSDRELARIFVEMFQPVGSDKIVVTFNDATLADLAKEQWKSELLSTTGTSKTNSYLCNVFSLDRRTSVTKASKKLSKNEKNKNKAKGFATRMAELEVTDDADATGESSLVNNGQFTLPTGTEVAIFVSPQQKEIPIIEKICNTVGMDTLIILLNFRKSTITNFGSIDASNLFLTKFNTVFHLGAVTPQSIAPGCLLYYTYDNNQQDTENNDENNQQQQWIVARKPNVGQPKTILVTNHRPNDNEIQTAYNNLQLSDIEKNVETAFDNVSKWFR